MQRYFDHFRDINGTGYPGASVTVYEAGTNTLASLYATTGDIQFPSAINNPTTTDSTGFFGFAIPNGVYDIIISGSGLPTVIKPNITITDLYGTFVPSGVLTVGATAPVGSSGGQNPVISMAAATDVVPGYMTAADHVLLTGKADKTTTISTTAPLSGGGSLAANRTLSIAQAGTSQDGYLGQTDYNNFNTIRSDLANTADPAKGANLVGMKGPETGEVALTQRNYDLMGYINCARFGPDPTGVADATSAIQSAVDAAGVGDTVFLDDGVYKISNPGIVIPKGVHFMGAGQGEPADGATLLQAASAAVTRLVSLTGTDSSLSNLSIWGEATKAVIGVDIGNATVSDATTPGRLKITNVTCRNLKWGFHTINGPFLIEWDNCVGWACKKGWYFDNTGAFLARGVNNVGLSNCHCVGNTEHGIYSVASLSVLLRNCGFDGDAYGAQFDDTLGVSIFTCTSDNSSTATFNFTGSSFHVYGCMIDASQIPFTIQTGSAVSKGVISHCRTTNTVGTYSVTPATTAQLAFDHNLFDKAIQNDGEKYGHSYRRECGKLTITVSGTPSSITKAITFDRAFSVLKCIGAIPASNYTNRINMLYSSDGVSGFTINFVRDDGATWTNGQTQDFYWFAEGTD